MAASPASHSQHSESLRANGTCPSYRAVRVRAPRAMCVQSARLIAAEHPAQDRLVSQVLHTREMGVLFRKSGNAKEEERDDPELEIASTSDGNIWSDLPFLVEEIRVVWTLFSSIPTVQCRNLSAFVARLASVGVRDPELCLVGLWILRYTLETPRPLISGAEASSHDSESEP